MASKHGHLNNMSNQDVSRAMRQMPALGRHFDLGTVYDAIKDEIIPGNSIKKDLIFDMKSVF